MISSVLKETDGQATVEAAFMLPILLGMVLLMVQPGILMYDRMIMKAAAADGCRALATSSSEVSESSQAKVETYIKRHLGAIPQQDNFHVHSSGCTWDIACTGSESSDEVTVTISTEVKPLPLIGFSGALLQATNDQGNLVVSVSVTQKTQPKWALESSSDDPSEWVGGWL